jgi:hypothetical protein
MAVLERFEFSGELLMAALQEKRFEQLVKSKKKEATVELIKRDDFLEIIRERTGLDISLIA